MSKIHHFKGFSVVDGDMKIKLNMSRFSRQYQEAQYLLDGMVMDSMIPFMPMISGNFINRTRAESTSLQGSGKVCAAAAPYGRFLYEGKTMVDELTGSPYARHGAKKYLLVSSLVRQQQRKILNTPDRLTHGHRQNGLMPLNDNTVAHGFAK